MEVWFVRVFHCKFTFGLLLKNVPFGRILLYIAFIEEELCFIAVKTENLHKKICRNYLEFFSKVVYIFLVSISHGFSDILGKIHKFSNTFYGLCDIATPHYLLCCSNYSSFCH